MVIIPFSPFFWTFEIFIIQNSNNALFPYNHSAIIKFRKLSLLKYYSLTYNPYSSLANWLTLPFKPTFCSRIQSWITFCSSLSCFFAINLKPFLSLSLSFTLAFCFVVLVQLWPWLDSQLLQGSGRNTTEDVVMSTVWHIGRYQMSVIDSTNMYRACPRGWVLESPNGIQPWPH